MEPKTLVLSLNLIDAMKERTISVRGVVITRFDGHPSARAFAKVLEDRGVSVFYHYPIKGYPNDVPLIVSDDGYGRNDYIETTRPLVIVQDADFEYDPDDYPTVIAPLLAGKADVVYGSRFMSTPGQVRNFRHEMGNKFLTFWSNFFSDIHLSDMETCYKAFRREVIQNLVLNSHRFGIEVEITAKLAGARALRIWEVPVTYAPRWYGEGKKITWRDGIAAMWHIFKYNTFFNSGRAFRRPWKEILDKPTEKP